MSQSRQSGFTLLEVMLSIAVIAIMTGLSLPFYNSFINRGDVALTSQSVGHMLRRASLNARASNQDSPWGVHFTNGEVILYKGDSFSTRDSSFDESLSDSGLTSSFSGDIAFAKVTGLPNAARAVTLTKNDIDATVSINTKGMVSYQ